MGCANVASSLRATMSASCARDSNGRSTTNSSPPSRAVFDNQGKRRRRMMRLLRQFCTQRREPRILVQVVANDRSLFAYCDAGRLLTMGGIRASRETNFVEVPLGVAIPGHDPSIEAM